jgi:hypothetical protein
MAWDVEHTDEFGAWFTHDLSDEERKRIVAGVDLLEEHGPHLGHPYSSDIRRSRHGQMRELRVQYEGRPYRVLYAFDPRRVAILLIGGDKTGDDRWYETFVPKADALYDVHVETLQREGLIDG